MILDVILHNVTLVVKTIHFFLVKMFNLKSETIIPGLF